MNLTRRTSRQRSHRNRRRSCAPLLECLDRRQLLSSVVSYLGGELRITGDPDCSFAEVRDYSPTPGAPNPQAVLIVTTGGPNQLTQTFAYPEMAITKVVFNGGQRGDRFEDFAYAYWIPSIVNGLGGDDYLRGGPGNDTLQGAGGDDVLYGGAGDDYIDGGVGGVAVYADNTGNDRLYGEAGNDTLHASDYGNNYLNGGAGNDYIHGWGGNDTLEGAGGDDTLYGGPGNDWLDGGVNSTRHRP